MAPKCTPNIVNYPVYYNNLPGALNLSKALNAYSLPLTTKQKISLRLEHQKSNKKMTNLKTVNLKPARTCDYHRG